MDINFQRVITKTFEYTANLDDPGKVADYIPELGKVNPDHFGIFLTTLKGEEAYAGDAHVKFSIQSIAKVLALVMAYELIGEDLWKRVGVEPSGDPFNSMVQLEYENGIPRNPLINAGAIVVCDILMEHFQEPKKAIIEFARKLSQDPTIQFNEKIAASERDTGFRNRALANMMKSFQNIEHDVEEVLDVYFHLSSIEMTCRELAHTFLFLANDGIEPRSGEQIIAHSDSKRINAIMQLCGFYDEAGEFSYRVGLPGKSGVGGGIVALHPDEYSIAVWSPRLNPKGNSLKGMKFLEAFTTSTARSIF